MLVETKNDLARRVLLCKEFTRGENSPFETEERHKNIQLKLVDDLMATHGLHKGKDRSNVFRVTDTGNNSSKMKKEKQKVNK